MRPTRGQRSHARGLRASWDTWSTLCRSIVPGFNGALRGWAGPLAAFAFVHTCVGADRRSGSKVLDSCLLRDDPVCVRALVSCLVEGSQSLDGFPAELG